MPGTIKKAEAILEILQEACARKELLILVTPFLRFESSFLGIQDHEIHVAASMSREDALYSLQSDELRIRFPHGLGFYEAQTHLLGLGLYQNRRSLRLAMPKLVEENDQRVAYRAERVGRLAVTYTTGKNEIHTAALADLSVTGARLHADRELDPECCVPGERILLSVPVSDTLCFEAGAVIRHTRQRAMGVEFAPPLPQSVLEPLSRWIFLKREDERERIARRLEMGLPDVARPETHLPARGILLLSADADLAEGLTSTLTAVQPLTRLAPTTQALKEGLASHPVLVILHITSLDLDSRRKAKVLAEQAAHRAPMLLLGTGLEGGELYDLSGELRTVGAFAWTSTRGTFFERLVQGIIRRHRSGGESPMAPRESLDGNHV